MPFKAIHGEILAYLMTNKYHVYYHNGSYLFSPLRHVKCEMKRYGKGTFSEQIWFYYAEDYQALNTHNSDTFAKLVDTKFTNPKI